MKKFYKLVTCVAVAEGHAVHLDGRPVKTPAGHVLAVPTATLAQAISEEWAAQAGDILPETMPLTQIATTALDHVLSGRVPMTGRALGYLDTDLLCYRADLPAGMAVHQAALWDPWLFWFARACGVELMTTSGLAALQQPVAAHEAVSAKVAAMTDHEFAVFQMVTVLTGSVVLALAFLTGQASPADIFDAAHAEEIYKAGIYNEAEHGAAPLQEQKQAAARRDLAAARIYLDALKK